MFVTLDGTIQHKAVDISHFLIKTKDNRPKLREVIQVNNP